MSGHRFRHSNVDASLGIAQCSNMKHTSITYMFALLSLIDQLIDDI